MGIVQDNAVWANAVVAQLPRPVVMSPGSRNTPLVLAFAARDDALSQHHHPASLALHCVLDERTAGFFALGLARATGKAAILLCTSGSAAAHYLPAVIEARLSRIPLIILSADRPPELHHCGAPQTVDQDRLFGSHVQWFANLGVPHPAAAPRYVRSILAQALDRAEGPTPGPVHINVPMREPLWSAASEPAPLDECAPAQILRGPPRLPDDAVDALAALLTAEPHGVIVAGLRAPSLRDRALARAIGALSGALGWPVLAEPTSQLRTAAVGSNLVTTYDALLRDADFATAHAPRRVLRLGQFPTSKVLGQWLARHGQDRTVLIDPQGTWSDPTHGLTTLVVAEVLPLVQALATRIVGSSTSDWLQQWLAAEARTQRIVQQHCSHDFWEGSVARTIVAAMPAGAALHVASSMPIRDIDSFAPASDIALFANRGANGIDGTIASAAGLAAAWTAGPTTVLLGDLAFLHDVAALQMIRQMPVPLVIVVVNNGGGGIFDFLGIAEHPRAFVPYFRTPQQADIPALAQSAGATARRVRSLPELRSALADAWAAANTTVIEAMMLHTQANSDAQPSDNVARHQAVWMAVREAGAQHRQASSTA